MGNYDIVPLFGTQFPTIFPFVLLVVVLMNYFKFYKVILKFLRGDVEESNQGFQKVDPNNEQELSPIKREN